MQRRRRIVVTGRRPHLGSCCRRSHLLQRPYQADADPPRLAHASLPCAAAILYTPPYARATCRSIARRPAPLRLPFYRTSSCSAFDLRSKATHTRTCGRHAAVAVDGSVYPWRALHKTMLRHVALFIIQWYYYNIKRLFIFWSKGTLELITCQKWHIIRSNLQT